MAEHRKREENTALETRRYKRGSLVWKVRGEKQADEAMKRILDFLQD